MTVQQDVPTGREVRAHIERWRELPRGKRPYFPVERWDRDQQRWVGVWTPALNDLPDDDTPQPGLRLVSLPDPAPETERVPWWEAAGRRLAEPVGGEDLIVSVECEAGADPVLMLDGPIDTEPDEDGTVEVLVESAAPSVQSPSDPAGGEAEAESHEGFEGASEAPAGECSGSPATDHAEAQVHHLVDEYGLAGVMECLRTHDDWLDAPSTDAESIIERAWGLLANVSEGDWTRQTAEWEEAVVRWRDEMFHPWLDRTSTPDWPIEDGTAAAPPEWQVSVTYTGTTDQIERIVGILGEPESATPATDSDPTSAVASSERASEVVGGGGGAGATTPTRPDPPEGWVVSTDREVVEAAAAVGRCRFLAWLGGGDVWGLPWGPSIFGHNLADGRYAVPVDMVAEHVCQTFELERCIECGEWAADPAEPWVPQVGDRVLVEALVVEKADFDGDVGVRTRWRDGSEPFSRVDPDTLRPFPEDGEA